jgi:3-hydroxybutyryl-CoA dehydrogenase
MDFVGLDVIWRITQYWAGAVGSRQLQTKADFIKKYIDKGRLGVKSGRGFYSYPDPAYKEPDFLSGKSKNIETL